RLLPRPDRGSDRRRDAPRWGVDHERRLGALPGQVAYAGAVHLSRLYDLLDAAALVRRRDDGRDPEYPRGLRHHPRVRDAGVCTPPDRGDGVEALEDIQDL